MTPGSFDPITAREITGDDLARTIEAKARQDADTGTFAPPVRDGATYWDNVQKQMQVVIYQEQYTKRLARNARKAKKVGADGTAMHNG
jgi:uncharacterized protein involved in high-affinity Fe2+ transport